MPTIFAAIGIFRKQEIRKVPELCYLPSTSGSQCLLALDDDR